MVREPLIPYHPLTSPTIKACLMFIAGILIAQHTNLDIICVYLCSSVIIILFFLCIFMKSRDTLATLAAAAVMVSAGMAAYTITTDIHRQVVIPTGLFDSSIVATGRVAGQCRYSHGNTTWTLNCNEITIRNSSYRVSGELTCAFFDRQIPLDEGSLLTVAGKLRRIRPLLTRRDFQFTAVTQEQTARLIVDSIQAYESNFLSTGTFFDKARRTVSHLIDRYPYGGHRAIVKAITIGEQKGIPSETNKQWAQSGIAHILAVSGLNVGILMMVLTFLLRFFPFSKVARFTITVLFMILYAGICGFLPPISRAVIMFTLLTGASLIERPGNVENSLFAALLIILAFDPRALFGASLQLSFAAVWTMTTFYTPLYNLLGEQIHHSKLAGYFLSLALLSTLATIGTTPIVASHFGFLPVYGIFINLVAVPLSISIIIMGLLSITATALGAFAAPVAHLLSVLTGLLLSIMNWIAAYVSSLPHSSIAIHNVSFFTGSCLALWLYLLSRSSGRPLFQKLLLYISLVFLLVIAWNPVINTIRSENRNAAAVFFDVGQGDAAFVTFGSSRSILVDTGPLYGTTSAAESFIVPSLKNDGISRLDGIFISHQHIDHVGGLNAIVRAFDVRHIYCSSAIRDSLLSLYGDRVIGLSAGDSITVGENGILVLAPACMNRNSGGVPASDTNESMLMFRFDVSGKRILFTGDIEGPNQFHAASWGAALRADILKVPHHGAGGLSPAFIRAVHPSVAVISCGANNRYGHPAQSTLAALAQEGAIVMRTDRSGSIMIRLPDLAISSR